MRLSAARARKREKMLAQLSFLQDPGVRDLSQLVDQLESMFTSVSSLSPLTPEATAALTQIPLADPGKRPWEISKAGYSDWAAKQLLTQVKLRNPDMADSAIGSLVNLTATVGRSQDLKNIANLNAAESSHQSQEDSFNDEDMS